MKPLAPSQLKVRHLYLGRGRNFDLGIWNGDKGFFGARYKFGYRVDVEYHYDLDPDFGTFSPYALLEEVPADIEMVARYSMTGAELLVQNPISKVDPKLSYSIDNEKMLSYLLDADKRFKKEKDELKIDP